MKKYFTNISVSIISLFIATLVFSLILTILSYNGVLSQKLTNILIMVISFILFLGVGFLYGRKTKKKGLLHGIVLSLIYILFLLVYYVIGSKSWTFTSTIVNTTRILLLITGSILGVNTCKLE